MFHGGGELTKGRFCIHLLRFAQLSMLLFDVDMQKAPSMQPLLGFRLRKDKDWSTVEYVETMNYF